MPLPEYVNFYMRRDTVEKGIAWLEAFSAQVSPVYGGLVAQAKTLLDALVAGMERSRHIEALDRIQEVVGPLPDGDPFEALAALFEQGAIVRVTSAGEGRGAGVEVTDLGFDLADVEPVTEPE